jgi:asparagine synthase (glutamine-hydrolysing)
MSGTIALSHDPLVPWFRGVEFVPAGTIIAFDLATGRSERHEYWPLPSFDGDSDASDEEFVRRYRELLDASVADCASADADVGLFLSGGVDSSAVAALAAPRRTIHTFTALTGSTLASGDAQAAHRTVAALGLPNHQVLLDAQRVPDVEEWKRLLWLLETPLCGPEQYYKYELYRFVKRTRPDLKGMLLGQAADEFNGGYSVILSGGSGWDGYMATLEKLHREHALRHDPGLAGWSTHHTRPLLRQQALPSRTHTDPFQAFVAWKYRDIQQYDCWHEDRTAAGNGVEARVPFLDHRIVELMASVPAARRERLLWDKWILREAVRDLLPPEASARHKVSFYHGDGEQFTHRLFVRMLAQDGCALVEEALAGPTAAELVDGDAVRDMLTVLRASRSPRGVENLLPLVNLGLLEQMLARLPRHPIEAPGRVLAPASPIVDWGRDAEPVRAAMLTDGERLGATELLELGDGVQLVRTGDDDRTSYVAIHGRFEYVVDERDDAPLARVLGRIAPGRTLGEVLDAAGSTFEEIEPVLYEALDAGVLVSRGKLPAVAGDRPARSGALAG